MCREVKEAKMGGPDMRAWQERMEIEFGDESLEMKI